MLVAFLFLVLQLSSGVQAQDAPACCEGGVMSRNMRQVALDVHNTQRSLLATGQVQNSVMSTEKFPEAKNMLAMEYDCMLEKKALEDISKHSCRKLSPRTTFSDVKRNYRYIITTIRDYQPEKSPEVALIEHTPPVFRGPEIKNETLQL
ncbi:hypothetical protein OSTOST_06820 [Ostertagia ostertagi]